MPDLAPLHPIVVHFAIALLFIGVPLRWLAFWKKATFAHGAAVVLLLAGTAAAVVAAKSGDEAHGPAERIPGARPVVEEHEELGERARNFFVAVSLLEIGGLVLARKKKEWLRWALIGSAVVGTVGLFFLFEAAEHGGELVYSYAGGVGTRHGEADDVGRLLVAGLYHQARLDRDAGRREDAARLAQLAGERFPQDPDVQLFWATALFEDRGDPAGALGVLERVTPEAGTFLQLRHGVLAARCLAATGRREEGRRRLTELQEVFPGSRFLERALGEL